MRIVIFIGHVFALLIAKRVEGYFFLIQVHFNEIVNFDDVHFLPMYWKGAE